MIQLAAWLHDLDPYAVKLWEGGPVRWYGLSYLLGFAIGYLLIRRVVLYGKSPLDPKRLADFAVFLAIGVIVGGRAGFVLFYRPDLLWTFTSDLPFWKALAINEGGMASHGGMLGGCLVAWWVARRQQAPFGHVLDLVGFAAPLGLFFGRLANFVNGELLGRPCDENFPLAVKFPQEMLDWPVQQLQAVAVQYSQLTGQPLRHDAYDFAYFAITRIQRGDSQMINLVEPMLHPRHPSQLYAAVTEGLIVFAVLCWSWRRPRKPWLISGLFCAVYAVMRMFNEAFRMPDLHLLAADGSLPLITRGQWLSVGLLLLGVMFVILSMRQKAEPLGGWRK